MSVSLFACLPVSDLERAKAWYEQLLGSPPAFLPNDTEAVWEIAEERYIYIEVLPNDAGHGKVTLFFDNLATRIEAASGRGIDPAHQETYENGVTKITYRDPDENGIGYGGNLVHSESEDKES
jgi:catechol 2,3-dioxygenase-like lactoylglutathione lyase family enzyme